MNFSDLTPRKRRAFAKVTRTEYVQSLRSVTRRVDSVTALCLTWTDTRPLHPTDFAIPLGNDSRPEMTNRNEARKSADGVTRALSTPRRRAGDVGAGGFGAGEPPGGDGGGDTPGVVAGVVAGVSVTEGGGRRPMRVEKRSAGPPVRVSPQAATAPVVRDASPVTVS